MKLLIKGLIGFLAAQVLVCAFNVCFPPPLARLKTASSVVVDQNGLWLRALPTSEGRWRLRADLKRTDPAFVKRLIAIEDSRFFSHWGVDPLAVLRAGATNFRANSVVSGASTLTMQTARMLEPRPRTVGAKLIEMMRAFQLELRFSKDDILGYYLTLAPYGGNIEGVRAASLAWFGHEPDSLTLEEQALLIAIPQSPEMRRPDRHPKAAMTARNQILGRFRLDPTTLKATEATPVNANRYRFEAHAWHTAEWLSRVHTDATIVTTLDAPLQIRLETLAKTTAAKQGPDSSVAIVVVDIKSRAVVASVGSGGLDRAGGYIDMTRAIRSPGSTLKPFIYGIGFDEGLIAPDTRLNDVATRFGDYSPENFDKVFHGNISVREALIYSLNIPAVAVLSRIGAEAFEARMRQAGMVFYRPKADLKGAGLALALGGQGVRLLDIVTLYAGLGDQGRVRPLIYLKQDLKKPQKTVRLMSPKAAEQVLAILSETPPPEGRLPLALIKNAMRPAFKTGTSYGFRDALAVGVGGGYAVLVWTGRPDGGARADQTGREASAPLLFDVFEILKSPPSRAKPLSPVKAPEALQTFEPEALGAAILFPPDKTTVYVDALSQDADGKLRLKYPLKLAARGQSPLRWYVNGAPLYAADDGDFYWAPETEGFYKLTLADATGQTRNADVRIKVAD